MRKLYLWWHNTKKYILLDIFLLFAISLSLFTFSNALGTYRMTVLSEELLENTIENKKSVYYMELYEESQFLTDDSDKVPLNMERYENINKLRSLDFVDAVHTRGIIGSYNGDTWHNVSVYDVASITLFPDLYRGSWFDKAVDENGSFNAVVYC